MIRFTLAAIETRYTVGVETTSFLAKGILTICVIITATIPLMVVKVMTGLLAGMAMIFFWAKMEMIA